MQVQPMLDGNRWDEAEEPPAAGGGARDLTARGGRVVSSLRTGARWVGTRLGPYRLVEEIGHGGTSRVYRASRDDDPWHRRVAVKIADGACPEAAGRFRSERRILAALDHPNIVQLLDGGVTEEGVPYLVLEYIEGEPITRYCNARRLGIEGRLQIFRALCAAVHYSHQNLVVHCDLKPGNVLVTPDGRAKLLDFGIATLLEPDLPTPASPLAMGVRPLTPDYASPEQFRGESLTTASDVYSLGVLLYELLTGCRPLRLDGQWFAFERLVGEVEPEPPSDAALWPAKDPSRGTPEKRSHERGTTPERLRHLLAGDLDNITMAALRKAPAGRTSSAEQLAGDLRRASDRLALRAPNDTLCYRLREFVRRSRRGVGIEGPPLRERRDEIRTHACPARERPGWPHSSPWHAH
jgi:eukaryotic-like serine/threonine-protein kinase